jgi:hypothetical protein
VGEALQYEEGHANSVLNGTIFRAKRAGFRGRRVSLTDYRYFFLPHVAIPMRAMPRRRRLIDSDIGVWGLPPPRKALVMPE